MTLTRVLERATAKAATFRPRLATNVRTGQTGMVRVWSMTRQSRVHDLPAQWRLREWSIAADPGFVLRQGDMLFVQSFGTYRVLEIDSPQDYSIENLWVGVLMEDASGNVVPVFMTNTTVAIRSAQTDEELTNVEAFLFTRQRALLPSDPVPGWEWVLVFDSRLAYSNGDTVSAGDKVLTDFFGTRPYEVNRPRTLSAPMPQGTVPVSLAIFEEPA